MIYNCSAQFRVSLLINHHKKSMAFDILTNSQIERIYSSNFVDLTNSLPQDYSNVTSSLISTNNDMSYSYNQLNHQMINGTFFQSVKPTFPSQSIDYQTELSIAIRVIAYVIIFIIAFVGNLLVILTLTCSRRMRTVTNTFLINLAISDLLLGIFCMPFTLYGSIARNFIFGSVMCKMIPYFQGQFFKQFFNFKKN